MHNGNSWRRLCAIGVFALAATAAFLSSADRATAYTLKTLHSFCISANCPDGEIPYGDLVRDSAGNLYGTAFEGGAHGYGVVFELQFTGTGYKYRVLHHFCSRPACADGSYPYGALILDVNGHLYGTAEGTGSSLFGIAFELKPDSTHSTWTYVKLYGFCSQPDCTDGATPFAGLTYLGAQNGALYNGTSPLFGTLNTGGAHNKGAVYRLTYVPGKTLRKETVLWSFCPQTGCPDGARPESRLLPDGNGDLFGTASEDGGYNSGAVFELKHSATGYKEIVLYSFCHTTHCPDGAYPQGGLIWDSSGRLLGTTEYGGSDDYGAAFRLVPNGINSTVSVLFSFCANANCVTGDRPYTALLPDANGSLFGTTFGGGKNGDYGTVFRLTGTNYARIYSFCAKPACADGSTPYAGLIGDSAGRLFGVTSGGGAHGNYGTVFELQP